jgi:cytochrome c
VVEGHDNNVNAVAFSPDGARLLSGGYEGSLVLWRIPDGTRLAQFDGHDFGVTSVAFLPDGRRAVSASVDATVGVWDLQTGREIAELVGHEGPILGVAVSADGRWAASGGIDRTVILWNLESRTFQRAFFGHAAPVWSLAFVPEGGRLLSAGADEVVRVWDVVTGEEIGKGGARRVADTPPQLAQGREADSRGARLFRRCAVCHTITPDGGHRAGPTLYGVFGRRAGTAPGYTYSEALRESDLIWTEKTIDALFAEGPHMYTPGSKMPLQRMPSAEDRADLIAYLKRATAPNTE